jgi:hypothetical protein
VNGKEGETERPTNNLLMPAEDNATGSALNFSEFVEGQFPEADAFVAENGLRWSGYLATGKGSGAFYTEGKNQLSGESGVTFTLPMTASDVDAFTGFSSVYVFTPENLGERVYETLTDELSDLPAAETPYGRMVVVSPRELFPKLGLSIVQVYDDGTERDVTDVMIDIGFVISKMSEGETTAWWGVLVADRNASDDGYNMPVVLSSIGEDGHILFDGKRDDSINGTFYIARTGTDKKSGSGGCDTFSLGKFAMAGVVLSATLRKKRRQRRKEGDDPSLR